MVDFSFNELQKICKSLNINSIGTKNILVNRIKKEISDSRGMGGKPIKKRIHNKKSNHPTNLIIVSHPDDEWLFAGYHLLRYPKKYKVLVLTNGDNKERRNELQRAMDKAGASWEIWNVSDKGLHIVRKKGFFPKVEKELEKIIPNFRKIITHNAEGEYGHPGHKLVNRMVRRVAQKHNIKVCFFGHGKAIPKKYAKKKEDIFFDVYEKRSGVLAGLKLEKYFYNEEFKCPRFTVSKYE